MKQILILIAMLFCFTTAWAIPTLDPDNEAVYINSHLKVIPKSWTKEDQELHTNYDITFPQIAGDHLTANAKKFNERVAALVENQVNLFTHRVKQDIPHMKTLPEHEQHNHLGIDYDFEVVKLQKQTIISVRLAFESMQAGRAHPAHEHSVLNFDVTNGKELALNDVFKPNADYLKLFSQYTSHQLNLSLHDKWMIENGTKPMAKNFKNWNVQNDSILITFDDYQVAPYVEGRPEVEIPFSELKNILSIDAPTIAQMQDDKVKQIG